jgi:hypothetical protein
MMDIRFIPIMWRLSVILGYLQENGIDLAELSVLGTSWN